MKEYERDRKEHKVTVAIGMALVVLLAIFVAKKRLAPTSVPPSGIRLSQAEDHDLTPEDAAREPGDAPEDEISVSVGGPGVEMEGLPYREPGEIEEVAAPDEEVIEPVPQDEQVRQDPQGEGYTIYVVRRGDTLSAIAQRFYGSASRWRVIARANNLKDPKRLRVGMELVIPQEQETEPFRDGRPDVPLRTNLAKTADDTQEQGEKSTYTVRKNDSLWKIAEAEYGDGSMWKTVFEANRNSLRNKDSLRVGQVLRLPKH